MSETDRLIEINLDDSGLPAPTPEIEQERRVALFDLSEKNTFVLVGDNKAAGPYVLDLAMSGSDLVMAVTSKPDGTTFEHKIALSPFGQVIKDYKQICAAYFDAVKRLPPAQIEAIDVGRRSIHDAGAQQLADALKDCFSVDEGTARRLFTLLCVLHFKE